MYAFTADVDVASGLLYLVPSDVQPREDYHLPHACQIFNEFVETYQTCLRNHQELSVHELEIRHLVRVVDLDAPHAQIAEFFFDEIFRNTTENKGKEVFTFRKAQTSPHMDYDFKDSY